MPDEPHSFRLGSVRAWIPRGAAAAVLAGDAAGCRGDVDLATGAAVLTVPSAIDDGVGTDLFSMLTVSAALLLLRRGGALVHAGAVVAPGGGAWLLVGDSHTGKSTTCLNLIRAGWNFLADDQVVLAGDASGERIEVQGWPRAFHLDEGWESGRDAGRRREIDPADYGPGVRQSCAPLAGSLVLTVASSRPTVLRPSTPSDSFAMLVRQAPWFLLDRAASAPALRLLEQVATMPSYALDLGPDVYRDERLLAAVLAPLIDASP
jgi:hypothetical protein